MKQLTPRFNWKMAVSSRPTYVCAHSRESATKSVSQQTELNSTQRSSSNALSVRRMERCEQMQRVLFRARYLLIDRMRPHQQLLTRHSDCCQHAVKMHTCDFPSCTALRIIGLRSLLLCSTVCTLWVKKTIHYNIVHNFAKCWPTFKICSLADSIVNMQQNQSLVIPPHLKHVVALPCETSIQEN